MTEYQHRVTIACPEVLIDAANHLALIVGESAADIGTFRPATYQDATGNLFSLASTAVKPTFLAYAQAGLPATPAHALDENGASLADRDLAQQALDTLTMWQPPEEGAEPPTITGLIMAVDIDPHAAIAQWGLVPVEVTE